MRTVTMKMSEMTSKDAIHDVFERDLTLPPYYGRNLDALFDYLTETTEEVTFRLDFSEIAFDDLPQYTKHTVYCLLDACMANTALQMELV